MNENEINNSNIIDNEYNFKPSKKILLLALIGYLFTSFPLILTLKSMIESLYSSPTLYSNNILIFTNTSIVIGYLIYFYIILHIKEKNKTIKVIKKLFIIASILLFTYVFSNIIDNFYIINYDNMNEIVVLTIIGLVGVLCYIGYHGILMAIFILISYKYIFKKHIIKSLILLILTIIISILIYSLISHFIFINSFKSLNDFKNELIDRNLYYDNYILLGIDSNKNNKHILKFNEDLNSKYPSYLYIPLDKIKINKNTNDNYYWGIYYTNGKIYVQPFYDFTYYNYKNLNYIISENNSIYIYNFSKNKYDIINKDNNCMGNRYFNTKNGYSFKIIHKDNYCEIFGNNVNIKIVNQVNKDTLNKYLNELNKYIED